MPNPQILHFKKFTAHPTRQLLFKVKWAQLAETIDLHGLKILDFGSGFGTTASYLAQHNDVTAIEPNPEMLELRETDNEYKQIQGGYANLAEFANGTFDLIICHNVLEFAAENDERVAIVKEFSRLLKSGGVLSIIKNNSTGRVIQKALQNDFDGATALLDGSSIGNAFGTVAIYDHNQLTKWGDGLKIEKNLTAGAFIMLNSHPDDNISAEQLDKMFALEMKVSNMEAYHSFSLLHHVILRKK